MPTDGAAMPAIPGLVPAAIADIESLLARRLAGAAGGASAPSSRACALNLVVCVEHIGDAPDVAALIYRVAAAHPMRVIGVLLDPSAPSGRVGAWIDAECDDGGGGASVCSELIALAGSPDDADRVVSVVASLLSPDLPVVLWWRAGSPFLSQLFRGAMKFADKIVVDSKRFGDGPAALDTLHRLARLREGRIVLGDMNWHRIATWRSTLSAAFDDPAVLALLPSLDRSSIVFSVGPAGAQDSPASARSLLLAGWLVSRLPSIAGHGDIKAARNAWATPGAIVDLTLHSSTSRAAVSIAWESEQTGICATAYDRAGTAMRRWRFAPDPEGEVDLLYRCVESAARDPLLDAALATG